MKNLILKDRMKIVAVAMVFILISCEKSDDLVSSEVSGTYIGTLTSNVSGKSTVAKSNTAATAVVKMVGNQIEVHCFGDDFDTTIMLSLYEDGDMINTCLTGNDFENRYGHMLGQGNMMNGSMHTNGNEWMQHLNNEHQDGDEHFGGFDMIHHSFNYTFKMNNGEFHFQGTKK
ncbi:MULTISPECIES: hypothetical protein [Flavobacteriaceae]|uniref:Lipoprotein n=2 Tax=Flavobacteriaceae TaxID=49546 RepID=A0A4Y8AUK9_9FLAO|nr:MULTISPECIES: hypothetical protein [Flavobacteriaceae]TEW75591.1 hypothetical protein E2488_08785 [Gramella jeungdoensis]GGK46466.1 hypothetical protein GCM10007963_13430 [Lutibacter litoralis]